MTASDEARKALEGVTPGPWSERITPDENQVVIDAAGFPVAYYVASANRRFIAWTREGVPALLGEIAAKDAEIARLRDALRLLHDNVVTAFPTLADLGPVANARAVLKGGTHE